MASGALRSGRRRGWGWDREGERLEEESFFDGREGIVFSLSFFSSLCSLLLSACCFCEEVDEELDDFVTFAGAASHLSCADFRERNEQKERRKNEVVEIFCSLFFLSRRLNFFNNVAKEEKNRPFRPVSEPPLRPFPPHRQVWRTGYGASALARGPEGIRHSSRACAAEALGDAVCSHLLLLRVSVSIGIFFRFRARGRRDSVPRYLCGR